MSSPLVGRLAQHRFSVQRSLDPETLGSLRGCAFGEAIATMTLRLQMVRSALIRHPMIASSLPS